MTRSETVLYLWDYFYITRSPARGDERPWRLIENATCRMQESEQHLRADVPQAIQLTQARRSKTWTRALFRSAT